jgi:hypothetical protein
VPKPKTTDNLTAINLKKVLWDTINKVKDNSMTAGNADAVACQAREILRTVRTQLMVSSQSGRSIPTEVIEFSESTAKA